MLSNKKIKVLQEIGITAWKERNSEQNLANNIEDENGSEKKWNELENNIKQCSSCALHQTRLNTVFGIGNRCADLLIIGEAPGAKEDEKGEPFVGRAGVLLDEMLKSINLDRSKVFIANILKCRPPGNRDPLPSEVASCTPFLLKQIKLISPKLIVATGRIAAQFLLDTKDSLSILRKQENVYSDLKIPVFVTYHPAYLLRSPSEKRKSFDDFRKIDMFLELN